MMDDGTSKALEKVNAALLEALNKIHQLYPICSPDCLLVDARIIAQEAIILTDGGTDDNG